MAKNNIGVRKDYQSMYDDFIRSGHKTMSDYQKFYRKLAKAADSRLIKLEEISKRKEYDDVLEWAYKQAQYDIRYRFGEDANRFDRKLPNDIRKMKKSIKDVLTFLNAPTSTVTGINDVFVKRAGTISKRYGINVDWQTVGNLFNSTLYKKAIGNKYGSGTTIKAIGVIQANKKAVLKAIKDEEPISLQINNKELERKVNAMLSHYKKDIQTLFTEKKL